MQSVCRVHGVSAAHAPRCNKSITCDLTDMTTPIRQRPTKAKYLPLAPSPSVSSRFATTRVRMARLLPTSASRPPRQSRPPVNTARHARLPRSAKPARTYSRYRQTSGRTDRQCRPRRDRRGSVSSRRRTIAIVTCKSCLQRDRASMTMSCLI